MAETARCPTCRKPVEVEQERRPKDYPFCSERCRLLDLQKWLTGAYVVPGEQLPTDERLPTDEEPQE